ncbi:MAG: YicC/YloC family endoribonuclease [Spirochaetaceae bacterium]
MKSMTGFGFAEHKGESIQASVEIKSYNNRYLDLNVNVPGYLSSLEPFIRSYLGDRVARGRIEVYVKLRDLDAPVEVALDREAVRAYRQVLLQLAEEAGLPKELGLSHFLRLEGVLSIDRETDVDRYKEVLEPVLAQAFDQFEENRVTEGAATVEDIRRLVAIIEAGVDAVEEHAGGLEEKLREHVQRRFEEIVGEAYDAERVYTEIASLLVRYSINEEVARLRTHVKSFRSTMADGAAAGKKLDFVCQEMNREINTIGSKSFIAQVNNTVVDMKDAVENIREQLRNVE